LGLHSQSIQSKPKISNESIINRNYNDQFLLFKPNLPGGKCFAQLEHCFTFNEIASCGCTPKTNRQ